MEGLVSKGKVAKVFCPMMIYSLIFLLLDYFLITNPDHDHILKYSQNYYSGILLLYCVTVALSIYLNEVFPWIYFAIPSFLINILFLFSDNSNITQSFIETLSTPITPSTPTPIDQNSQSIINYLTKKYYTNNLLLSYLMLMTVIIIHSEGKRIIRIFHSYPPQDLLSPSLPNDKDE